ncbi:MAG: hypothetical protein ACKVQC_02490, partial [Elusimicrobiota bacterium]
MIKKIIVAVFVFVFFAQNVAMVHSVETGLWEARGKALTNLQRQKSVFSSLPKQDTSHFLFKFTDKKFDFIPSWVREALFPFVTFHGYFPSPKNEDQLVVLLQDIHYHIEAQESISKAITSLADNAFIKNENFIIGAEGAPAGNVSYQDYLTLPNRELVSAISKGFLLTKIFSGVEQAAVSVKKTPSPFSVFGIENKTDFLENIEALKAGEPFKNESKKTLSETQHQLSILKKQFFDKALFELDEKFSAFENNSLNLVDYALYLDQLMPCQTI